MKKKIVGAILTTVLSAVILAGCSEINVNINDTSTGNTDDREAEGEEQVSDLDKANEVAALIDAIYVQEWTEQTEEQCIAARDAWNALTDEQKELVEGESADPDYFGRDTGDASADDPLNADEIGENEILVVSFGTSFNDSRAADIGGIEKAVAEANPDWSVRRAFTAQIIINHVFARDDEKIDNMKQALDRAVDNGVKNLVIQPTHLMHGAEYDEMISVLTGYVDKFETVKVAEPLLGPVGSDAAEVNEDKAEVAKIIATQEAVSAGYDNPAAASADGVALVLMGHGTSHEAKITYSQMQTQMDELGYDNVFIGTVEGEPEETSCDVVIGKVKDAGFKKVVLRPLMVVAGDHANNDMAGEEDDSWASMFTAADAFDEISCQIEGMGRVEDIEAVYVAHTAAAFDSEPLKADEAAASDEETSDEEAADEAAEEAAVVKDGSYVATFKTDSAMFHVNEANEDKGVLTVKDGEMTIHVSLAGDGILNLFVGTAEDASKDGAVLLEPTEDEVTYKDGTTETVYGFDIPVPALDEEFDVAIIGKKGVWYDHKVSVSSEFEEAE